MASSSYMDTWAKEMGYRTPREREEDEERASEMARRTQKKSLPNSDLARVTSRLEQAVLDFCRRHIGQDFNTGDLFVFVNGRVPCSPSSPDRVLRALRRDGFVDYEVTSKTSGVHRILSVRV